MSKLKVSLLLSVLTLLSSFRSLHKFRYQFRLRVENINGKDVADELDVGINEDSMVAYLLGEFPVPSTFQLDKSAIQAENEDVDYTKLPPYDPRFLDMPYPTEGGPLSAAYARHMLWRRKLNDGDRVHWQKWAIYKRLGLQYTFDYGVEDYVLQNLMKDSEARARKLYAKNQTVEATLWSTFERGLRIDQTEQVSRFMMGFYKAFNCKNPNLMRPLWLPNRECELVVPGFTKARGNSQVYRLYRQFFRDVTPFAKVEPEIVSIQTFGNIAVVITIERLIRGYDVRPSAKKIKGANALENAIQSNNNPKVAGKERKMLAISIVRRANKQWRMLSHTSTKLQTSTFTNNSVDVSALPDLSRPTRDNSDLLFSNSIASAPSANVRKLQVSGGGSGSRSIDDLLRGLGKVGMKAKRASDGTSELVVSMNDDQENPIAEIDENVPAAWRALIDKGKKAKVIVDDAKKVSSSNEDDEDDDDSEDDEEDRKNDDTSIVENAEHSVDFNLPAARQTVLALRYLYTMKLVTEEEKTELIKQVVDGISTSEQAFVETAYKTILMNRADQKFRLKSKTFLAWDKVGLEEFAQQCKVYLARIQKRAE